MKKQYTKPSMEVYELMQRQMMQMLLCASGNPPRRYDDEFGYMSGDTTDMNNMA